MTAAEWEAFTAGDADLQAELDLAISLIFSEDNVAEAQSARDACSVAIAQESFSFFCPADVAEFIIHPPQGWIELYEAGQRNELKPDVAVFLRHDTTVSATQAMDAQTFLQALIGDQIRILVELPTPGRVVDAGGQSS